MTKAVLDSDNQRDEGHRDRASSLSQQAIGAEIRITQSVQTQANMPVLLLGNAFSVVGIFIVDWQASLTSYAIFPLTLLLILLLPMLRSFWRLRGRPKPSSVSTRRILTLEIYSLALGLVWAVALFLLTPHLEPIDAAMVLSLVWILCFGAVALMPSMPRAAIAYGVAIYVTFFLSAFISDVIRIEILIIFFVGSVISLSRAVMQSWEIAKTTVVETLERLNAEAEVHNRETEAMRSMLEAIPFQLILLRGTGAWDFSGQAARQFGVSEGQLTGTNIRNFFVDVTDFEKLLEIYEKRGRVDDYEVQFRDASGNPFWALISTVPLRYEGEDCWLQAIHVIDDRKKAEAALQSANESLAAVSDQLKKYITPQLFQSILRGDLEVKIVSKRKKLTIFFSDIANFAKITNQLEPEELTGLLNEYLTEMSLIAQDHGGVFDKFIGDATLFYFGDPESKGTKEDASACVRMAIEMQRRLTELEIEWRERGLIDHPFKTRVGINTGYCTVGNFGSEDRMDHTIIGAEVNLAARLESQADAGGILLANETYSLVKDWLQAEEREAVTLKGFAKPVRTFAVKGIYEDLATEGRVFHRKEDGFTVTIDSELLSPDNKAKAIQALEEGLARLKD
jgi:PAS domain S-box-containing protein